MRTSIGAVASGEEGAPLLMRQRQPLPLMMEVECVVLECGIMVFGLLRNLLFDVCELWRWSV